MPRVLDCPCGFVESGATVADDSRFGEAKRWDGYNVNRVFNMGFLLEKK
jgi:hypothetical protein